MLAICVSPCLSALLQCGFCCAHTIIPSAFGLLWIDMFNGSLSHGLSSFHSYCMSQTHSKKIDLTGRTGVVGELNFTNLQHLDQQDSSDDDVPISSFTLKNLRSNVDALFDQDSLCLSTFNDLLPQTASESEPLLEEEEDAEDYQSVPESNIPSDSVPHADPPTQPVYDYAAPPAGAFSWPPHETGPVGFVPDWVTRGPTPDGPSKTEAWPPYYPPPSGASSSSQDNRHHAGHRSPSRPRRNYRSKRGRSSTPHRPSDRASPPRKRNTPSSRCMVKVNFAQAGRSMHQILDRALTIRDLLEMCRAEWKIGPNASLQLLYNNDRACSENTPIHRFIPLDADNPKFEFYLSLRRYNNPADVNPEVEKQSERFSVHPQPPSSGFTWLGPHAQHDQSSKHRAPPPSPARRDNPIPRRDCHRSHSATRRTHPSSHQRRDTAFSSRHNYPHSSESHYPAQRGDTVFVDGSRFGDRRDCPAMSVSLSPTSRAKGMSAAATPPCPDLPIPPSKASFKNVFPPECPYPCVGKASVPMATTIPPRPTVSRSRSPDSLNSLEIDADCDVEMEKSDVEMTSNDPPHSTTTRSASERRRYADSQKQERDRLLLELRDTWRYIDSYPPPGAQLLTASSFSDRLNSLLAKGRRFVRLAMKIGCSEAAKSIRQDYHRRGRKYNAGAEDLYDAIFKFNARVMEQADRP